MTTETSWSGAVQREVDGLQRTVDARFLDVHNRLDKLLAITEYHADKRVTEIQLHNLDEKIEDNENDIVRIHSEVKEALNALRHELSAAITTEREERKKSIAEYIDAKKSQFRWLVSMVMIPLGIAIVDLLTKHK